MPWDSGVLTETSSLLNLPTFLESANVSNRWGNCLFVSLLVSFGTEGFKTVELNRTGSISVVFQLFVSILFSFFFFFLKAVSHVEQR